MPIVRKQLIRRAALGSLMLTNLSLAALGLAPSARAQTVTDKFNSSGSYTFLDPTGVTSLFVTLAGAGGGFGGGGATAASAPLVAAGALFTHASVTTGGGGGSAGGGLNGGDGFVSLSYAAPVPEASSAVSLGVCLLGFSLLALRARKKKSSAPD